jgi:hypothetical protein
MKLVTAELAEAPPPDVPSPSPPDAPIIIGGEQGSDACGSSGEIIGLDPNGDGFLSVRSGPGGSQFKEIDRLYNGNKVYICANNGPWLGAIYNDRRDLDQSCGVSKPWQTRQPYTGPCRYGWVHSKYVRVAEIKNEKSDDAPPSEPAAPKNPAQAVAPQSEPASPPPKAAERDEKNTDQVLASWSGTGSKNTRPFSVNGPWEIQWDSDSYFFVSVYDRSGERVSSGGHSDSGSGSSFQPLGGHYYLEINGGGTWTVKVVAVAEEEKAETEVDKRPTEGTPPETPKPETPKPEMPKWETLSQAALSHGEMPPIEKTFINIVDSAKERYSRGATELQKGAARPFRAQQICAAFQGQATDWIGTITELTTNGDGYGVLNIEIEKGISVWTANNSFSDIGADTLIAPSSSLYKTLLGLKTNTKVRFSGSFFRDSEPDCVRELSITMDGSMTDPAFLFRFKSVNGLDP